MTLQPWWIEYPGLLEAELASLDAAGIAHELDEAFRERHGAVKIAVYPEVAGTRRPMEAVFPDLYPWFRPEVISREDDLPKHQGPFGKNLCLLPRETDAWHPGHDTLAGILTTQLPRVYESQDAPHAAELEVHQAEPFTAWYANQGIGALIVDSTWDLAGADHGVFEYGLFHNDVVIGQSATFIGAVLTVSNEDGDVIAAAHDTLWSRFDQTYTARWQGLPDPVRIENAAEARDIIRREHRHLDAIEYRQLGPSRGVVVELVGVVFPIEADYGGATADAWMFIVSFAPPMDRSARRSLRGARHPQGHSHWLPGQRGGPADLQIRTPELAPVRGRKVVVVGAGAIGAPTAEHLTQAGAQVRVIDGDIVEAATAVRHPLGQGDAGRFKAIAMAERLNHHSPHGDATFLGARVGATRLDGRGTAQHDDLNEIFDGADLIFDATGSHGVGLFLSDCAARLGIPFLNVTTTFGCWGGRVMALHPADGACFDCVYLHLDDRIKDGIPVEERLVPPEKPSGEIRPVGCGDATYTGTSFDAAAVVAVGVRAAISLLCVDTADAYPPIRWNVAIIWNRDPDGGTIAGRTFEFTLDRRDDCNECNRRSG